MDDETWKRHANPWSVLTRFLAIPAAILAVWSRVWIGRWAVVPVAGVIIWLWLNLRVFSPVSAASSWSARGIYGERLWLENWYPVSRLGERKSRSTSGVSRERGERPAGRGKRSGGGKARRRGGEERGPPAHATGGASPG